jgi:hypothetical protein
MYTFMNEAQEHFSFQSIREHDKMKSVYMKLLRKILKIRIISREL